MPKVTLQVSSVAEIWCQAVLFYSLCTCPLCCTDPWKELNCYADKRSFIMYKINKVLIIIAFVCWVQQACTTMFLVLVHFLPPFHHFLCRNILFIWCKITLFSFFMESIQYEIHCSEILKSLVLFDHNNVVIQRI